MPRFTEAERTFLAEHRLACIATVSLEGEVDVAPVAYRFDGRRFLIGGRGLERTLKYRNVSSGSSRVALAVEDGTAEGPRGLKVHGGAEVVTLDLPEGARVGELRRRLAKRYPPLASLLARSAVAVDNEFAGDDFSLRSRHR